MCVLYHYKGQRNTEQVVWTTEEFYLKRDELNIHMHVSHGEQRVLVKRECRQSTCGLILDP